MWKKSIDLPVEYDHYEAGEIVIGYKNFEQLRLYRVHICTPPSIAGQNSTLTVADSEDTRHSISADDVRPLQDVLNECGSNEAIETFLRSQTSSVDPLPIAQEKVKQSAISLFTNGSNLDVLRNARRFNELLVMPSLRDYECHPGPFHNGVTFSQLAYTAHQNSPSAPDDPNFR